MAVLGRSRSDGAVHQQAGSSYAVSGTCLCRVATVLRACYYAMSSTDLGCAARRRRQGCVRVWVSLSPPLRNS
eukprot:2988569-Rhodomonas_salina.4